MRTAAVFCALALLIGACELNEVVVAEPDDVVIAEIMLRTDQLVQRALLHRTINGQDSAAAAVPGARIEVTDSKGVTITFGPAPDRACVDNDANDPHVPYGTCYVSDALRNARILPGETYTLRITLADGGVLTGTTQVPGDFRLTRPDEDQICSLPANDTLRIGWRAAPGTWVYAAETNLRGLRPYFAQQNIDVDDPLRLFGLSASAQDTTILFPTEFGLFQRFNADLTDVLVAIQNGLPSGIVADVVVAAADRNYVNWQRGGDFNPSGAIRIPSIRGDGTGVFGSLVPHAFQVRVASTSHPPC